MGLYDVGLFERQTIRFFLHIIVYVNGKVIIEKTINFIMNRMDPLTNLTLSSWFYNILAVCEPSFCVIDFQQPHS